ncbi:MAG: GtrA family protein [Candidatus Faecousia sp.]|nr:GtrA family protein [Candidatus Faecousia sp.]MDY4508887.1 GtrA family protein [Candidatus Faecousia sp.]
MKQFLDKYMGGLFGYLIVGGLATIVEWAGFWLFSEKLSIEYLLATALAFAISTFANWLFGRLLVFRGKQQQSLLREILSVYLASIVGLLLNLLIMFLLVQLLGVEKMIAKMAATVLVFTYNYLVRKLIIYRK